MVATLWLISLLTTTVITASECIYVSPSKYHLSERNLLGIKDNFLTEKRTKPSLSIVNPLDILRQRLLLEMARRQMRENTKQVELNRAILKNVGKREQQHRFGPFDTATMLFDQPIGAGTLTHNNNNAIPLPSLGLFDAYELHKDMLENRPYDPKIDELMHVAQKQQAGQKNDNEPLQQRPQVPQSNEPQRPNDYADDTDDDGAVENNDEFMRRLKNY